MYWSKPYKPQEPGSRRTYKVHPVFFNHGYQHETMDSHYDFDSAGKQRFNLVNIHGTYIALHVAVKKLKEIEKRQASSNGPLQLATFVNVSSAMARSAIKLMTSNRKLAPFQWKRRVTSNGVSSSESMERAIRRWSRWQREFKLSSANWIYRILQINHNSE